MPESYTYDKYFVHFHYKHASNFTFGTSAYSGADKFLGNLKIVRFWSPTEFLGMSFSGVNDRITFGMSGLPEEANNMTYLYGGEGQEDALDFLNNGRGSWHTWQSEYKAAGVNLIPYVRKGSYTYLVEGKMYDSVNELATEYGMSTAGVVGRCKSKSVKFQEWTRIKNG